MTKAFSIRIPAELLTRAKTRAAEGGTSLTAFVTGAIEARLEAPPLTAVPMAPVLAPRETLDKTWRRPLPGECAHPFRDKENRCRVCGEQR